MLVSGSWVGEYSSFVHIPASKSRLLILIHSDTNVGQQTETDRPIRGIHLH